MVGATVGWHVHGSVRSAVRHFLRMSDGENVEVCAAGDGSLVLLSADVPKDFDMAQYGRFEFRPAGDSSPTVKILDQFIVAVDRIRRRDATIGWRFRADTGVVVFVNNFDNVYVSDGQLPPDFSDATVG